MDEGKQTPTGAVGFVVMVFPDETAADHALDAMKAAQKAGRFAFEDAAVLRQDRHGKVHYRETGDMSAGKGAGIGALIGGVLGALAGPAGAALGAGAGAAIGGAISAADKGYRSDSLAQIGAALQPGASALIVVTDGDFLLAVQQQVPVSAIRSAVAALAPEIAAHLAAKIHVALGMFLVDGELASTVVATDAAGDALVEAVITGR